MSVIVSINSFNVLVNYNTSVFFIIVDTTFMYILGSLIALKMFQSRHPDSTFNAPKAFMFLGGIVLTAVIGVVSVIV